MHQLYLILFLPVGFLASGLFVLGWISEPNLGRGLGIVVIVMMMVNDGLYLKYPDVVLFRRRKEGRDYAVPDRGEKKRTSCQVLVACGGIL